jgi:hypothetical protein
MFKNLNKIIIGSFIVLSATISTSNNVFADMIVTNTNANFRENPNTYSQIINTLRPGQEVIVKEDMGEWSAVLVGQQRGYIRNDLLTQRSVQKNIGEVELIHWSEARHIFAVGEDAIIYDINTGKTYNVRSFSNGSHADIEPITKEDTRIMKETFGGVWSWQVRPVTVTVGGRTMAASINGQPHGGGGPNQNNGMNGHVCIHFLGSRTHNGNTTFEQTHQNYVMQAFRAMA